MAQGPAFRRLCWGCCIWGCISLRPGSQAGLSAWPGGIFPGVSELTCHLVYSGVLKCTCAWQKKHTAWKKYKAHLPPSQLPSRLLTRVSFSLGLHEPQLSVQSSLPGSFPEGGKLLPPPFPDPRARGLRGTLTSSGGHPASSHHHLQTMQHVCPGDTCAPACVRVCGTCANPCALHVCLVCLSLSAACVPVCAVYLCVPVYLHVLCRCACRCVLHVCLCICVCVHMYVRLHACVCMHTSGLQGEPQDELQRPWGPLPIFTFWEPA